MGGSQLNHASSQESARQGASITYALTRGLSSLAGALLGWLLAEWLVARDILSGPINIVYLTLLGLLLGYLLSSPLAEYCDQLSSKAFRRISQIPPDAVLAAGVGVTVALLITVLLNSVLEDIPGFTWYWSLIITFVLVTASGWFFVANRQFFSNRQMVPSLPQYPVEPGRIADKVIDTSAIIDGRIVDVIDAHFLDGRLLIPKYILHELQQIADSDDPLRRKRGRRGLEVLDQLVQQHHLKSEVINDDPSDIQEVDEKLVRVCQLRQADLITTDYNLNRIASLQGVRVLNVNQLANAVKMSFLPGERLSMHIVKQGREPGQGLAYLEDGTMVVIEDAAELVGSTVDVIVTSNLQTNMGRMIFARINSDTDA